MSEEDIDKSLFEPVPSSVTLQEEGRQQYMLNHNKRTCDDISAIQDSLDVFNNNSQPIRKHRRTDVPRKQDEENSIETGAGMEILERIELLEEQMENVRSDVRIARLECEEQKDRLNRHLKVTRQFWEKTNKEFLSYHKKKMNEAIERLTTYSVEKMKGIHRMIAEKQASLADSVAAMETALRDCWFVTDAKVTEMLEKEVQYKCEGNKENDEVFEDV